MMRTYCGPYVNYRSACSCCEERGYCECRVYLVESDDFKAIRCVTHERWVEEPKSVG